MERSILGVGVSSGFTSIIRALFCLANMGRRFAGYTLSEVPATTITSHKLEYIITSTHTSWGSGSPNQTTSGLRIFPHLQRGGISEKSLVILSLKSHTVHFIVIILPCSSKTFWLPALWCSPSIFWVNTQTSLYFASSEIATCPAFGFAQGCFFFFPHTIPRQALDFDERHRLWQAAWGHTFSTNHRLLEK